MTTTAEAVRPKPHSSYRHEAFVYRGHDEFLAGCVPFIRDGVAAGEPVMVAVIQPRLDLLRAALGPDADGVQFVDMADLGHNPARIIPAWREFVDEYAVDGQPVRGVGEPIWAGRRPEEIVECQFHEALLNVAVDPDIALWLRCPYDADALDQSVLDEAEHSHPLVVEMDDYRGSTAYGGLHHVEAMFSRGLPAPATAPGYTAFGADDMFALRDLLAGAARAVGVARERLDDLQLAVHEIVTNSLQHGGGTGEFRVWCQDDSLVCEVSDPGHIQDPLVGRVVPPPTDETGRGLWLANQLSDLVQIRTSPGGTTVRVLLWLPRRQD